MILFLQWINQHISRTCTHNKPDEHSQTIQPLCGLSWIHYWKSCCHPWWLFSFVQSNIFKILSSLWQCLPTEEVLSTMNPILRQRFDHDICAVQWVVQAGFFNSRIKHTDTVVGKWTPFISDLGLESILSAMKKKVPTLQWFAIGVRSGELAINEQNIASNAEGLRIKYGQVAKRSSQREHPTDVI